ncbi:MAG: CDGSH iron-sulfur domain-containing protein [Gemmatimonadales bacterium]
MSDEHPGTLVTVRATDPGRGPFRIEGDWKLVDVDGHAMPLPERKDPRRISLCGCGMSAKWPICDGTHKTHFPPAEPLGP